MNIGKQTFNTLDVLYDDKKWGKRIDPDEWNANFKVLEEGHNELAVKLNQQVTDIDTAIQAATSDGGQNISVQYGVGTETLQNALDNVVSDINNRYTKNEVDASIGSNTNSLIANAEYNESTGVFTFTRKDGSSVVIDTVIEKVPASMALVNESDGSVSLVVTNQDGSTTKTNVTSLIEDTVINSSNTVNATSVTDAVKKVTTYTLVIKPNSIGLSHIDSALTAKFEETQSAKTAAVQAKDSAVAAKTAAVAAQKSAETYASNANTYSTNASISADESADSALEAKGYAEQASSYKNSAELAKVAAEKARDEAQAAAGGDYTTKLEFNSHVSDTTLHTTADEKTKLAGIEANANKYVHPSSHSADMITENSTHRFVTDTEKTKLSGIEANANNYTHPSSHPATMITEDSTHMFVTDAEKAVWSEKDVFIATLTSTDTNGVTTYSCDKTFDEIKAASNEGKICILKYGVNIYIMTMAAGIQIRFSRLYGNSLCTFTVRTSNVWNYFEYYALPGVATDDNGKILQVVNGVWTAVNNLSTVSATTLLASNWDSTSKTYSFEADYPSASYDIEVSLDGDNATNEQINAWIVAKMLSSSSNKIIAKGTIPTIDIPIILVVKPKSLI